MHHRQVWSVFLRRSFLALSKCFQLQHQDLTLITGSLTAQESEAASSVSGACPEMCCSSPSISACSPSTHGTSCDSFCVRLRMLDPCPLSVKARDRAAALVEGYEADGCGANSKNCSPSKNIHNRRMRVPSHREMFPICASEARLHDLDQDTGRDISSPSIVES